MSKDEPWKGQFGLEQFMAQLCRSCVRLTAI